MLQGINILIREGWLPTMVEGDSLILVHMAKQLGHRGSTKNVLSIWFLAIRLEDLCDVILSHQVMSFHHVKQDVNKVADILEKARVEERGAHRVGRLEDFKVEQWMPRCRQLAALDASMGGQVMEAMMADRERDKRHKELTGDSLE